MGYNSHDSDFAEFVINEPNRKVAFLFYLFCKQKTKKEYMDVQKCIVCIFYFKKVKVMHRRIQKTIPT